MAFASFSPSSLTEMLSQLNSFAGSELGWGTTWNGTTLTLTPKPGQSVFSLVEQPNSYQNTGVPQLAMTLTDGADSFTTLMSHVYSTSVCWFFGGAEPEPWLLIVVQTSPGAYRHAYIGYVERYGAWSGGAVCTATQIGRYQTTYYSYTHAYSTSLFDATSYRNYRTPTDRLGGMILRGHGQAGQAEVAYFGSDHASYGVPSQFPRAAGGPSSWYAQALRNPGVAPYSGEAALAPITLFADITRIGNWTPLGRVCGIRLVNVADFNPEDVLSYAGRTWRVFPLNSKANSSSQEPTSGDAGLAVLQEA